ncbi:MAG TPA: VOC family protein [Chthoniobacterales bacterium]
MMNTNPNPIREGFHSVTPALVVRDAAAAIEFYQRAFGAAEHYRLTGPDGRIMHAQIQIGDSILMLCDEMPEWGCHSAETLGGSPISLAIYVPDVDTSFARALTAGASVVRPVTNQFYGDRSGVVADPFRLSWSIATQVETVSPEEMEKRAAVWIKENVPDGPTQ